MNEDENHIVFISIIFIIIGLFFYYLKSSIKTPVLYVQSKKDGREYLVVDKEDKYDACEMLAQIRYNIFKLRDYLYDNREKYPNMKQYIILLHDRLEDVILVENVPESEYTSYNLNKGEKIALCLRSRITQDIHDINVIMYVVLHEMAHSACPYVDNQNNSSDHDHDPPFRDIFVFLQIEAQKIGIYKHQEYDINPHEYCGMILRENLLR